MTELDTIVEDLKQLIEELEEGMSLEAKPEKLWGIAQEFRDISYWIDGQGEMLAYPEYRDDSFFSNMNRKANR